MRTKLQEAFHYKEDRPMTTVQRRENQRPPKSHAFYKAAKNYQLKKKTKNDRSYRLQTGRVPGDMKERWMEKIPPRRRTGPMA